MGPDCDVVEDVGQKHQAHLIFQIFLQGKGCGASPQARKCPQRCLGGDKGQTWHGQLLAPQGGTDQPGIPKEQHPAPKVLSTVWGVRGLMGTLSCCHLLLQPFMLLTSTQPVNRDTWLVNQDLVGELGLLAIESGLTSDRDSQLVNQDSASGQDSRSVNLDSWLVNRDLGPVN